MNNKRANNKNKKTITLKTTIDKKKSSITKSHVDLTNNKLGHVKIDLSNMTH